MAERCFSRRKLQTFSLDDVLDLLDDSDIDLSESEDEAGEEYDLRIGSHGDSKSVLNESSDNENDEPLPTTSKGKGKKRKRGERMKWHSSFKRPFQPGNTTWHDAFNPPDPMETPAKYFLNYFTPEIFQLFAEQTNIYYLQAKGRSLGTNASEICRFFGASIIMANLGFPRIRMFWQRATKVDRVAESMSVNRYFQLRNSLHINAAREPHDRNGNKFWKVQPVLEAVRNRCLKLPREEFNSVDEQMVPFTGRLPAKQFIKNKPNPVGLKNFVICGKSGRALDFEIYQGAGTGIPDETRHLGLGASVVLRLAQAVPKQKNYKICFDNFFTGMPLIKELKSKGIHSIGVVKKNRLMGCELKSEKELKKEGRGAMDCKISDDGDVCVVRWLDNGAVTLASSFVGIHEKDQVRRWSEREKEHIMVDRPKCVQVYNDYMGGVDKLDFLISLYRIKAKTRKWPVRVMLHFIDFALANSWLEYRDIERANGTPKKRIFDLLEFRNEVAEALLKANPCNAPPVTKTPVGRPRISVSPPPNQSGEQKMAPTKKRKAVERPVNDVRYDGYMHFPSCIKDLGQRCKYESCKGRSRVKCSKCNVCLCLTKDKNCFLNFHSK